MLTLFPDREDYRLLIQPVQDWERTRKVTVRVTRKSDGCELGSRAERDWETVYMSLANMPDQNEHQLAAMAKGLDRGRILRFEVNYRRSDLESAGFLVNTK